VKEAKVPLGRSLPPQIFKLNEKIQIAFVEVEISPRGGAEQLQPIDPVLAAQPFDLGTMLFNQVQHSGEYYTEPWP
jgi:hypothetical protein